MNVDNDLYHYRLTYPEEVHYLDDPNQVELIKIIYYKVLLSLPLFITYLYDYEDMLPADTREHSKYFRDELTMFTNRILDEAFDEFKEIDLNPELVHDPVTDSLVSSELGNYFTFDDHYDYMDIEIRSCSLMVPEEVFDGIVNTVINHVSGMAEYLAFSPECKLCYEKIGQIGEDSTVHVSSEDTLYLILGYPKPRTVSNRTGDSSLHLLRMQYPEEYVDVDPNVKTIFDGCLYDFLDYVEGLHNNYKIPDFYEGSPNKKSYVIINEFLKSRGLYIDAELSSMLRETFLILFDNIMRIAERGMILIKYIRLSKGVHYDIALAKRLI